MRIATLFLLVLCSGYLSAIQAQLSPTFYAATCPNLERIARQWFSIGVLNALTAPAAILRLSFHDCSVNVSSEPGLCVLVDRRGVLQGKSRAVGTFKWHFHTSVPRS